MGTRHTLFLFVGLAVGCAKTGSTGQLPSAQPSANESQAAAVQRLTKSVKEQDAAGIRTAIRPVQLASAEEFALKSLMDLLRDLQASDREDQKMREILSTPPPGQEGRFARVEAALKNADRIKELEKRIKQREDQRRYVVYARLHVEASRSSQKLSFATDSHLAVFLLIEDLKSADQATVVRACRILEVTGSAAEKALPQLNELVSRNDEIVKPHAERAIKAIRQSLSGEK
jgi:hypothetical protein